MPLEWLLFFELQSALVDGLIPALDLRVQTPDLDLTVAGINGTFFQ